MRDPSTATSTRKTRSATHVDRTAVARAASLPARRRITPSILSPPSPTVTRTYLERRRIPRTHLLQPQEVNETASPSDEGETCIDDALSSGDDAGVADSEVGPGGNAFILRDDPLAEEVNELQATLDKAKELVRDRLVCQICFRYLEAPYTTNCGHTFCGKCLKHSFTVHLKAAIEAFRVDHLIGERFGVPTSRSGVQWLVHRIQKKHVDPTPFFLHPCPSCRSSVCRPPVLSLSLRSLVIRLRRVVDKDLAEGVEVATEGYGNSLFFEGLFF
ncbi:hypothetical protein NLJ89_g6689 [Agrocybe chaxingu]|uniref:RING-type domain-containing protein n=1 Tax=Agrocybe chaxingu TaxID=84603 RepID=A0A9W8K0D0_9AGAR|nr:hypothetical protein NLJ89_g6689 [Agrocybe chaxingu]